MPIRPTKKCRLQYTVMQSTVAKQATHSVRTKYKHIQ